MNRKEVLMKKDRDCRSYASNTRKNIMSGCRLNREQRRIMQKQKGGRK